MLNILPTSSTCSWITLYQLQRSTSKRNESYPAIGRSRNHYSNRMSSTTETHESRASGTTTPPSRPQTHSASSYLSYPVTYAVSGLIRRLTEPSVPSHPSTQPSHSSPIPKDMDGVYTPPHRTASPFQPPPLTPLTLRGIKKSTSASAQLLSRALAEEIRLLIPPRLQLVNDWTLAYSVEQDGTSLGTLYKKCDEYRGMRSGFVLVVRDGGGGVSFPIRQPLPLPPSPLSNANSADNCSDLRRLPNRPPAPLAPLLRHRRMFPLARLPPPIHALAPILPPSPPTAQRRHDPPPTQHHPQRSQNHAFPFTSARYQQQHWRHQHARPTTTDPLQSLPLQWRQRLHDLLRAQRSERGRRGRTLWVVVGWGFGEGGE